MTAQELQNLRFPIGEFQGPEQITPELREKWMSSIRLFPEILSDAVLGIEPEKLAWLYRPAGWNIAQLVHHCADSHMNAFIRCKLALTEESPTIKPYHEAQWAQLPDGSTAAVRSSISILTGVHARWVQLFANCNDAEQGRSYLHPEHGTSFNLNTVLANYSWHCMHHFAHIQLALNSEGKHR